MLLVYKPNIVASFHYKSSVLHHTYSKMMLVRNSIGKVATVVVVDYDAASPSLICKIGATKEIAV